MTKSQARPSAFWRSRRPLYALGAAALALPIALSSTPAFAASAEPSDGIQAILNGELIGGFEFDYLAQVDDQNIWNHDEHLSYEIGPRVRGTENETEAVHWVAQQFESYGLETEIEEVPLSRAVRYADATPSRTLEDTPENKYASWQFAPAPNNPTGFVSGSVVDIGSETEGIAERADLEAKLVLATYPADYSLRAQLMKDIYVAGAKAVIWGGTNPNESLQSVDEVPADLPGFTAYGTALNQAERISAMVADGGLSLSIETGVGETTSHNAIGVLPAANGDEDAPIIYLGAHIDSVNGSPGASDNGSGVAIMLEIARIMSQYEFNAEIRFGAWGAEEAGYVGSNHHVKTVMTEEEHARTLGAWNMDMAGTSYPGTPGQEFQFWALTADVDREPLAPSESPVLDYSNQISLLNGSGELPIGTVSRSDHQPFHDVGIKAAVFSWMHWAGGTNIILEPAYHRTTDTLANVSQERMGHAGRVLGGGAFAAALSDVTVNVTDASGEAAADTQVAVTCEGDEAWRDAGVTGDDGTVTTRLPATDCDFVALDENGASGSALAASVDGDIEVDIELSDIDAPIVTFTTEGANEFGWHQTSPVEVAISATDNSGVAPTIEYSFDGAEWLPYTEALTFEEDGSETIWARATDAADNVSSEEPFTVGIDTVKPTLSAKADAGKRGVFAIEATDGTSGIASVEYLISGGEWTALNDEDGVGPFVQLTAELKLGAETTSVEFRATDFAGNLSDIETLKVKTEGGLVVTGSEAVSYGAIAAAVLLLAAGSALLVVRRRNRALNEEG